jgi:HrpA-like RNA helicase
VQGSSQIAELAKRIHWLNYHVLSKGITYAKKHSNVQQNKYKSGGGGKKDKIDATYYLAPVSVMSKNIQKGGREYKDLYSDIASVQVELYDFDSDDNSNEDIEYKPITDLPETYEMVQASRRVILATNAIETGLTIDTLKYCIDTGYVKEASFNPNFGCSLLVDKNVTQASSRQRRGRAGRKAPGEFYACYTKEVYDKLPTLQFPDIVREDISLFLLDILITETNAREVEINASDAKHINYKSDISISGVRMLKSSTPTYATISYQKNSFDQKMYHIEYDAPFDAKKLDFIQYPSADNMEYSIEKMHALGFIDHEYKPTLIGLYGAKFRKMSLENIRMILAGYANGCNVLDLITIACFVELSFEIGAPSKSYKTRNPLKLSDVEAMYYTKTVFCDEFIEYIFLWHDFMQVLNKMGDKYISNIKQSKKKLFPYGYIEDWCEEVGVKLDGLIAAIALRDEVISDMMTAGLNPFYNGLEIPEGRYSLVEILNRNLIEGLDEIKKIKQCIYDGYYLNIYIWNDMLKSYTSARTHNTVSLISKLVKNITHAEISQSKPQKIIIGDVMLRESMTDKGMYEFTGSIISVLDGFIEYDPTFI